MSGMVRLAALALTGLALLAGCGEDGSDGTTAATEAPTATQSSLERGIVRIGQGRDALTIDVEIADTQPARELGLMHRESLGADEGMVFVFDEDVEGGFWMKNTLIPLSIAYYDAEGRIVRIMDMEPCRADPCPVYDPGVPYRGALEVNKGAFARWGVVAGDRLTLER
jgi:uncharacterized protein